MLIKAQKCPFNINQIVEFATDINPNLLYPRTTWARFAEGKTTVGYQNGDTDFGTIGQTAGEKNHAHTAQGTSINRDQLPAVGIGYTAPKRILGQYGSGGEQFDNYYPNGENDPKTTENLGSGQSHTHTIEQSRNLMPYVVTSKWRRTA